LHGMAYYIFLKSLRSLEEFRKNPHVKIPPKSPCANFQSLGKFKNPIFNSEILFFAFSPTALVAHSAVGPADPTGLSPLPQAGPSSSAHAHCWFNAISTLSPFDSRFSFSAPSLYPPLTHGPRVSDPSSPPRRPTPVRNPLRRRSPRRPLRASDAVKSLPPPHHFPP
jgi:hypothetical protein